MSGDVDRPVWSDMHVHEVVDDSALNVPIVFMNQNLLASVKNLDEAKLVLLCFVDGLILGFVMLQKRVKCSRSRVPFGSLRRGYFNSLFKVCNNVVDVLVVDIVWTGDLHLSNVAVYDGLVKADGFDKEQLESFLGHDLVITRKLWSGTSCLKRRLKPYHKEFSFFSLLYLSHQRQPPRHPHFQGSSERPQDPWHISEINYWILKLGTAFKL